MLLTCPIGTVGSGFKVASDILIQRIEPLVGGLTGGGGLALVSLCTALRGRPRYCTNSNVRPGDGKTTVVTRRITGIVHDVGDG